MHHPALLLVFLVSVGSWSTVAAVAQDTTPRPQVTGLVQPVAIAVEESTAHAFIVERGGRLLRWAGDSNQAETIIRDWAAESENLDEIVGLAIHAGSRLTIVGKTAGRYRLATWIVYQNERPTLSPELSRDLELSGAEAISAVVATDVALYIATRAGDAGTLWRIAVGDRALGVPSAIHSQDDQVVTGLAVSAQGHVAAAWAAGEEDATLRFHDATNGAQLLSLQSDAQQVSALAYDRSGGLYGSCTKADRQGIYRFDVFFNGAKQSVRATEVVRLERLHSMACAGSDGIVLIQGNEDGRVLRVRLRSK